jgi:hypothetical protein
MLLLLRLHHAILHPIILSHVVTKWVGSHVGYHVEVRSWALTCHHWWHWVVNIHPSLPSTNSLLKQFISCILLCLHQLILWEADSGVQWGRVETRLGDVEREVKEQWHDRHRELVAQLRSLAREVRIAKGSSVAVDSGPPQGFVAAAEVEWGARPGFEFRLGGMGLGYYRHRDGGLRVAESGKRRVEMEGDRRSRGGRLRSEDRREGVQYFAVPLTSK